MKDVTLFLITFTVVMVAFASGVSYIFNMASGTSKTSSLPSQKWAEAESRLGSTFCPYPPQKSHSSYNLSNCIIRSGRPKIISRIWFAVEILRFSEVK